MKSNQEQEFWQYYQKLLKNTLVTEEANALSAKLSELCHNDLPEAFEVFRQIEFNAVQALMAYLPIIENLRHELQLALHNNQKIYLVGCGASGRLAMLIKRIFEEENWGQAGAIICVAAGGDISLIRSVEEFEDHADYGARQLIAQGYTSNDLVIGLSASGESKFILGALAHAATHSQYRPYLLCNNPLNTILERNPEHLAKDTNQLQVLSLDVGSMALTGSTRLQATTAMQIVLSLALAKKIKLLKHELQEISQIIANIPLQEFMPITQTEANILKNNDYILYSTNSNLLGLSLLADITERSPTFNLTPFENQNELSRGNFSPFYLSLDGTANPATVWQRLFASNPTCLNWHTLEKQMDSRLYGNDTPATFKETSSSYIDGFDLSAKSKRNQGHYLPQAQHIAAWQIEKNELNITLQDQSYCLNLPTSLLQQSLIFKFLLNSHSTLMMGQLDFFQGNLMLSLKPSNYKLMDRAIRYARFILKSRYNLDIEYKVVAAVLFQQLPELKANESIVLKMVAKLNPCAY